MGSVPEMRIWSILFVVNGVCYSVEVSLNTPRYFCFALNTSTLLVKFLFVC